MITEIELTVTRENPTPEQMWDIRQTFKTLIPLYIDGLPQVVIAQMAGVVGEPSIVEEAAA